MIHRKARRLLPAVLDQTLPATLEAEVRAHAEGCERCSADLTELVATEELLRRLPLSLVPREASPGADARLAALARWSSEAEPQWSQRMGLSAVGAFAAAAVLVLAITVGGWSPAGEESLTYPTFAAVFPENGFVPNGWR